jgi:hypothetical protein
MKLLPLYTNCLLKSDALSGGADVGCDERAFLMHSLGSMDVASTVAFFYPRLLPVHDLPSEAADRVTVPHPLRCSIEKVPEVFQPRVSRKKFLGNFLSLESSKSFNPPTTLKPILHTIASYDATGSLARFENKNIFYCVEKRSSLLHVAVNWLLVRRYRLRLESYEAWNRKWLFS